MYVCIYVCMCVYVCMYVCMYVRMSVSGPTRVIHGTHCSLILCGFVGFPCWREECHVKSVTLQLVGASGLPQAFRTDPSLPDEQLPAMQTRLSRHYGWRKNPFPQLVSLLRTRMDLYVIYYGSRSQGQVASSPCHTIRANFPVKRLRYEVREMA